jgi:GNAT superfamily N-acetyltransferase
MNILAVHPHYQRCGLGGRLLAPVLAQADKEGRKAYIEASEGGAGLYKKFGWRECAPPLLMDMAEFGEEGGKVVTEYLMREPGAGGPGLD